MSQLVKKFQDSQWVKLEEINFSKKAIIEMIEGESVLDIGCGDGLLLDELRKKNFVVKGVDISKKAIELCKERDVDCEQLDISRILPFKDNSYDTVLLIDVLEHLFQPSDVLGEAFRVCKKYVYISVPNFVSLPARLQVLFGKTPENNTPRDGHVYWMTYKEIIRLLKNAGFIVEEVVVNTFWENNFITKHFMYILKKIRPSLFGLSFIIKARKI